MYRLSILIFTIILILFLIIIISTPKKKKHINQENYSDLADDAKKTLTDFIGPSYNYAKHIKSPSQLGASGSTSFTSIIDDAEVFYDYVNYLMFNPKLGNNFFVKSGKCDQTSVDECKGKDRWLFVRNIPTGNSPCLQNLGIQLPPGMMAGLIPGFMEDVGTVAKTPFNILNALMGKTVYSTSCISRTEKTGNAGSLVDETKCAPPEKPETCLPNF
jgi:cbb3-type cytochrome oxidase subunit 3